MRFDPLLGTSLTSGTEPLHPLSLGLVARLHVRAAREGCTWERLLMAAFGVFVFRLTRGEEAVELTASTHPHQHLASEPVLLRLQLDPAMGLSAVLAQLDALPEATELRLSSGDGLRLLLDNGGCRFERTRLFPDLAPIDGLDLLWEELLQSIASLPTTPIGQLPLLSNRAIDQLRASSWSTREPDLLRDECLHDLFRATVEQHASLLAVLGESSSLTYAELDARSNALARKLRALGAGPGRTVAFCLPRGIDVYVAFLGILKSGAAYVPIDPDYPADRIAYIVEDSAAITCLTPEHEAWQLDGIDASPLASTASPDDLAYIIYTSGSTGRPKGVAISHRSACHFVRAEGRIFGVKPEDRVYQGFSIAFDASVEEVWLAFFAGASLYAPSFATTRAGAALAEKLTAAKVTVLSTVPTLLSVLDDELPTVRLLIVGGEACPPDLAMRWSASRRFVNTYGPTEATVVATWTECRPGERVTIGQPLPNYRVFVLDGAGQPLPPGVPGELCLGGPGLAQGYVNRPDLTAEKFFDATVLGERLKLYRTGDLVAFDEEGQLLFLGRIDAQVKLRGFRIELAEIESVLLHEETVQSAVVALREDIPGDPKLIAYVIPHHGASLDFAALREHLKDRLAHYMVPAQFVVVDSFPTLPSGKVDRKRLPRPPEVVENERPIVAPHTEREHQIERVWAKLFGRAAISVEDDFFDLGGHSLLAARMISELRKDETFADLAVVDVYQQRTIAKLAQLKSAPVVEPVKPAPRPTAKRGLFSWLQPVGLYVIFAAIAWPLAIPMLEIIEGEQAHWSPLKLGLWGVGIFALSYPARLLFLLAAKWLVIGRYKAGSYPVWSSYYWRHWFVRRIQAVTPLIYLRGTPLLPWYFRLLGARIGQNVYLGSFDLQAFDLIDIGDGANIGMDAGLLGYAIEDGQLKIGSVAVGRNAVVGNKSVVRIGASLGEGAVLDHQSLLPENAHLPHGELWAGAPAVSKGRSVVDTSDARAPDLLSGLLYAVTIFSLMAVPAIASMPSWLLFAHVWEAHGLGWAFATAPIGVALFTIVLCGIIAGIKWLLIGHVQPGRYPLWGPLYFRKWIVDTLMQMSLMLVNPLYATLYLPPWFRLLGAKLGRNMEISTVAHISPDLLTIGEGSFVADSVCLGAPSVRHGWIHVAPITVGERTFLGNSSLIPSGAQIGSNCLVGCLSVPPANAESSQSGRSWLGSPGVFLPRRQESRAFPAAQTFQPPRRLYLLRGAIEFFRVTLPNTIVASVLFGLYLTLRALAPVISSEAILLLVPFIYGALAVAGTLAVVALKWLIVGRYTAKERPLWSHFVWRTELVTALHESAAVPLLLGAIEGTTLLSWYFRLVGAKVGRRVCLETTQLTEFDLVRIGDDSIASHHSTLQTHLFEDRVMKMSTLTIGRGCSVGALSVVLYDSEMQDGASLGSLSLLMKGETLPAGTRWEGSPARKLAATPAPARRIEVPMTAMADETVEALAT